MKGEFEGKFNIVWNDRDVEMDLYASLDYDGDINDIDITNAHYIDNNEPIEAEEIERKVKVELCEKDWSFWGVHEKEDTYSGEMDCVDYWKYKHGIEV